MKILIEKVKCTFENGRLVQVFDESKNETNQEWCIHVTKLRWSCEECEEHPKKPTEPKPQKDER